MPKFENIGDWVEKKYGGQVKAAKAMGTTQGVISNWINGQSVPSPEKQELMRGKGDYDGPMPEPKKRTKAGGPYVTEAALAREAGRLEGKIEEQGKVIARLRRRLNETLVLIQDLGHRAGIEVPPQEPLE